MSMDGEFLLRSALAGGIDDDVVATSEGVKELVRKFVDVGLLEKTDSGFVGTALAIDAIGLRIPSSENPFEAVQDALEQTIGDVTFRVIPAAFLGDSVEGLNDAIALVKVVQTPDHALVQNVMLAKHLLELSPAAVRMATKSEDSYMMLAVYPAPVQH